MILAQAWQVLVLFLIPIGGGIPAGVLLARSLQIDWPWTALLYLVSDIILAILFEPLMLFVIFLGRRSAFLTRISDALRSSTQKTIARYGHKPSPWTLILISFGLDPMTGRAVAIAAGHGFVMGWTFAIAGDLLFFGLMMASTLWLSDILGDGTWASIIIVVIMTVVSAAVQKWRNQWQSRRASRPRKDSSL